MKILVCVDGSQQSLKGIEEAVKMALGCNISEVAVIHVIEKNINVPAWGEGYHYSAVELERIAKMDDVRKEEGKKILAKAVETFKESNISAKSIFREGHPAETIAKVASEDGYDLVVLGSRGLGGLRKLLLGSVSNAIVQEVKANVLVVK